jgi:ATP phosphoribosyltransferase
MTEKVLRLGLPKGSLQDSTINIFRKAGFHITVGPRSYIPAFDDSQLEGLLIRAQEMAPYVDRGILDAGLTGLDWVMETGSDVVSVADLNYAKAGMRRVRWVVAVPESSTIKDIEDLNDSRISTELVNVTREFFESKGISAKVEFSWGSTEVKPPLLADAIVELTETGGSLKANNLREVATVLESTTRLIANKKAWEDPWKKKKLQNLSMLLKGALMAEEKVGLKMNIRKKNLTKVTAKLPAMQNPTISDLTDQDWVALDVIVDEKTVREIIPKLKRAGAKDIVEYPLNKVIY